MNSYHWNYIKATLIFGHILYKPKRQRVDNAMD